MIFKMKEKKSYATYNKQIEAIKLSFADALTYVTDPTKMSYTAEQILDDSYATKRRELIKEEAITADPGDLAKGGTVYLSTADGDGNMVYFFLSNYMGFGYVLVVSCT